jgi:hypothetical protein
MFFRGKSEGQLGRVKLYGGGKLTVKIGFSGEGKSGPQILGQKLGKSLRIPRIDLKIKRKSTISDGNPDDFAETLRKALIAVLGGNYMGGENTSHKSSSRRRVKLYEKGKSYRYIR